MFVASLGCITQNTSGFGASSCRNAQEMRPDWHENCESELTLRASQGSLSTYRFCDEVWTFLIKNVQFKLDNGGQIVTADKVKIVSCNAKKPGEGP